MSNNEIISELANLYGILEKSYKVLAEEEKCGRINSEKYKVAIEHISMLREVIDKKLKALNLDIDETNKLLDLLCPEPEDEGESFMMIMAKKSNLYPVLRLAKDIEDLALINNVYEEDTFEFEGLDDLSDEELDEMVINIIQTLNIADEISIIKNNIIAALYNQYITEEIKKSTNKKQKNKLIDYKYRLIFLDSFLEKKLINNDLSQITIYEQYYALNSYIKEYSGISYNVYSEIVQEASIETINDILYNSDNEYLKIESKILLLKTLLTMNYDEDIEKELNAYKNELLSYPIRKKIKDNLKAGFALNKGYKVPKNVDFN